MSGAPSKTAAPSGVRPPSAIAVALTYAVQGIGYAVIVTALPTFQIRHSLDATLVSIILLGVCVAAALGSIIADAIAVRRSSRRAVQIGFALQVVGIALAALSPVLPLFLVGIALFGIGLGTIDASATMQGVLAERRTGRTLLGRFYAASTTGSIVGALAMTWAIGQIGDATWALLIAAALQLAFLLFGSRRLDPARAAHSAKQPAADRVRLPTAAVIVTGLVILAAFTTDAAVSSWGSAHLIALGAALSIAPLGYGVYQGGVLLARLVLDPITKAVGPRIVLIVAVIVALAGGLIAALVPGPAAVFVGFAVSGLAVGAMVPIAFGMAGRAAPARSDEMIARVNLFNYAGAVLGAVGVGLLFDAGTAIAFLLPVVVLLGAIPALRRRAVPAA